MKNLRCLKHILAGVLTTCEEKWLEALFLSEIYKPSIIGQKKYRMHSPDFLNALLPTFFSPDFLTIVENKGISHDWEILSDSRISAKSTKQDVLPRLKKYGEGLTKPPPIMTKNVHNTKSLGDDEFDYLMCIMSNLKKGKFGMYLFDIDGVKESLKNSHIRNNKCDENGYNGQGQVLFYPTEEYCLESIEMGKSLFNKLTKKYSRELNVSSTERNIKWANAHHKSIQEQFGLKGAA